MGLFGFVLSFVVLQHVCLSYSDGFLFKSTNEVTQINKTSDEFLEMQVRAIAAYKKTNIHTKRLSCSYKDHTKALSFIPQATSSQQTFFSNLVEKSLNGSGMRLYRGAKSVSQIQNEEIHAILIWDGMMINSLEYFNVLYGGQKYFHVGFGLPFPNSYYAKENTEGFRFYDLKSCIPFTEWIFNTMGHRVKEILMMPMEYNIKIRNAVNGVAALLPEKMNTEESFNLFPNISSMELTTKAILSSKSNESLTED